MNVANSLLARVAMDNTPAPNPLDDPTLRWPQFDEDERRAVAEVLASGRVNALVHGDRNRAFEAGFAALCEVDYAVAVTNGTAALELALHALGIGPGDEVIVPATSFFATTSCVVAVGATPVFADILPYALTIDPASVERMVGPKTRAILCVHLGGRPCEMAELERIASAHGLWLVEDCAQAHGARVDGRPVGGFGDAAAFSFCTDKIMSTGGEGGMVMLKSREHWRRAWSCKDHGKDPEKVRTPAVSKGFRYIHDSFGTNARMTEMQAAIGCVQLGKLPDWLERRRRNAATLTALLGSDDRIIVPEVPEGVEHACYRFYAVLDASLPERGIANSDVIALLVAQGIPAGSGSCPDMSLESAFAAPPRRDGDLPAARDMGRRTIALPVDHLLGDADMARMAAALIGALDELAGEAAAETAGA